MDVEEEANINLYGLNGSLINEKKAAYLFKKAITLGSLTAYPILAHMHTKRMGVRKNEEYANDLLMRGISAGNPFCACQLCVNYNLSDFKSIWKEQEANKYYSLYITAITDDSFNLVTEKLTPVSHVHCMLSDMLCMYIKDGIPDYMIRWRGTYRDEIIELFMESIELVDPSDQSLIKYWSDEINRFKN